MKKTYAAFYIPKYSKRKKSVRFGALGKIKQKLSSVIKKTSINTQISDLNSVASFILNSTNSMYKVKYAISGMSDLLSYSSILNKTKCDSFFDVFSPILNYISFKLGYSSVADLKRGMSVQSDIDKSAFLTLLMEGVLSNLQEDNYDYSGYGEEIPVDVVENCQYLYSENVAEHPVKDISDMDMWLSDLGLVQINFVGHIKNSGGELVKTNTYMQKLGECMKNKKPIILRIGKDVYENCLIERMSPVITNIYELKLVMTLKYNYSGDKVKSSAFGGAVLNPSSKNNASYLLSNQIYAGIFS